jgi:hypothetical protein
VRLFCDGKDVLVVYNEYHERRGTVRARAYFLNQKREREQQGRAPFFVNTNLLLDCIPVPSFAATNVPNLNPVPPLFAVIAANGQAFTLHDDRDTLVSYELPVYNDGLGRVQRIALTPVAVTVDLTIVGGCIGYLYLAGLAHSNSAYTWP